MSLPRPERSRPEAGCVIINHGKVLALLTQAT